MVGGSRVTLRTSSPSGAGAGSTQAAGSEAIGALQAPLVFHMVFPHGGLRVVNFLLATGFQCVPRETGKAA